MENILQMWPNPVNLGIGYAKGVFKQNQISSPLWMGAILLGIACPLLMQIKTQSQKGSNPASVLPLAD